MTKYVYTELVSILYTVLATEWPTRWDVNFTRGVANCLYKAKAVYDFFLR